MTSRLARARVQPRRPATSPRVPRSRAGPYLWPGGDPQRTNGRCPAIAGGGHRASPLRFAQQHRRKSIPPTTERAGAGYGSRPPCQRPCRSWNGWIAPTSAARRPSVSMDTSISPSLASRGNSPSSAAARWTCARQVSMAYSTRVRFSLMLRCIARAVWACSCMVAPRVSVFTRSDLAHLRRVGAPA